MIKVKSILLKKELVIRIRLKNKNDKQEYTVKTHRLIEEKLMELKLRGIDGISKVFLRKLSMKRYTEDGEKDHEEWVLDTDGINLLEVMSCQDVDFRRTTSNDINEILSVFGIEACRYYYYIIKKERHY
jgi:DNA-directed RNA polymerase II subunit RPB1